MTFEELMNQEYPGWQVETTGGSGAVGAMGIEKAAPLLTRVPYGISRFQHKLDQRLFH